MSLHEMSEEQVKQLLATHPAILGEDAARAQESSHVVHCMQCETQFQVDLAAQRPEDQTGQTPEELMHIKLDQQPAQEGEDMSEHIKSQSIPVNIYSVNGRVMVSTPMPGLEPENITIEVTSDGRLRLQGGLRGTLKEHDGKERFLDEWSIGAYAREVALPVPVNAVCANASYGNGVLVLAFPLSDHTAPARLTLERVAPAHGQHKGNSGHPPICVHVRA